MKNKNIFSVLIRYICPLHVDNKSFLDRRSIVRLNSLASSAKVVRYFSAQQHRHSNHDRNHNEHQYQWKWSHWFRSQTIPKTLSLGVGSLFAASNIIFRNPNNARSNPDDSKLVLTKARFMKDLRKAVVDGDIPTVRKLVPKFNSCELNLRHELGWQLLHVASVNGHAEICEILLTNGASVNDIDHYRTPFETARRKNIDVSVVALIRDSEFNRDLSRVNFYGCTPLHYAALSDSLETLEVLQKFGADPHIVNELGFKAVHYARGELEENLFVYEQEYEERLKKIEAEERRRFPLEQRIKEHLIGQDAAISMVAATIRRKENGWFDENHPLVFLFLGSSGVGKTELAKQVSNYLHKDNKKGFIRLDMSEYQEKHSVARMIGAPPGYVGHENGGQLTDSLKKCKNAVVLLDEVEKAHPDVLTILLQLFDEGRLTDSKGHTIDCKEAIFIMTSNLASESIARHANQLRAEQQNLKMKQRGELEAGKSKDKPEVYQEQVTVKKQFKETIMRDVLKRHFKRDEFLGRINEMVYFLPFSESEKKLLVIKELKYWQNHAKKKGIDLTWDDEVVMVISNGYDQNYGARSIKYELERRIINEISEMQNAMPSIKQIHISTIFDKEANEHLIKLT